jgi:hypothetical protein
MISKAKGAWGWGTPADTQPAQTTGPAGGSVGPNKGDICFKSEGPADKHKGHTQRDPQGGPCVIRGAALLAVLADTTDSV